MFAITNVSNYYQLADKLVGKIRAQNSSRSHTNLVPFQTFQMADRLTVKVVENFNVDQIIKDHIEATGTDESFFIADVGDIVRKFVLWNQLLPRVSPDFAFKCNNHVTVVATLAALGKLSESKWYV